MSIWDYGRNFAYVRGDEAEAFFIRDIHQLRQLRANGIYCAPITILDEQGAVGQNFDAIVRLPMLKLADKGSMERTFRTEFGRTQDIFEQRFR